MRPKAVSDEKKLEPWIETYTGRFFHFLSPSAQEIDIRDIAHSLAYTCRFTGHSKKFYSVAEHSIFVSYLANDPLAGLLHDASEAYITDIASPIKPYINNYKALEDTIMGVIASKFGFGYPLDADIKDCDAVQLKTEARHLLRSRGEPWAHQYETIRTHGITPECMSPREAELAFLKRFEEVRVNVEPIGSDFDANEDYNWRVYGGSSGRVGIIQNLPSDERHLRGANSSRESDSAGERERSSETGFSYIDPRFSFPRKTT